MVKRIYLPKVTMQKDAKAHPFPFQIALQTKEFIQGAVFYFAIYDEAAGIFLRMPDSIKILEEIFINKGMKKSNLELSWQIFQGYKSVFESMVFRNVLLTVRSYWDWYTNKLAEFIIFAQENVGSILSKRDITQLRKITFKEITNQLEIMGNICSLDFDISEETKGNIKEMSLVRNLGLHNRWEVDKQYLEITAENKRFQIGDTRDFDAKELGVWHKSLIDIIGMTCKPIAIKYVSAPMFPPDV